MNCSPDLYGSIHHWWIYLRWTFVIVQLCGKKSISLFFFAVSLSMLTLNQQFYEYKNNTETPVAWLLLSCVHISLSTIKTLENEKNSLCTMSLDVKLVFTQILLWDSFLCKKILWKHLQPKKQAYTIFITINFFLSF